MAIIVSDSSVIIDLTKVRLVESAFRLPHDFYIPDVMFADELISLGDYTRQNLLAAGLQIGELDSAGVQLALSFPQRYSRLSTNDCFALALAETTGSVLLTGDRKLTDAAGDRGLESHGLIWLCDEMNDHGTVDRATLRQALEELDRDPLVRLPRTELRRRIRGLGGNR